MTGKNAYLKTRQNHTFIPLEVISEHPHTQQKSTPSKTHNIPTCPAQEPTNTSGLRLHTNNNITISIDKRFHESTLKRILTVIMG